VGIAIFPFLAMSLISRGARFFLVAGLVKLGGDRLESTILKKVEWLGWGTLAVVVIGFAAYKFW
ncbi:MAG: DedA family protein, partial [Gammaproteobacteria bacterium]|nr:DedA family protein [Gammaproteobacteria bacterium]